MNYKILLRALVSFLILVVLFEYLSNPVDTVTTLDLDLASLPEFDVPTNRESRSDVFSIQRRVNLTNKQLAYISYYNYW
jgi:hypothetical protein